MAASLTAVLATSAPMSSETTEQSASDFGTSPVTMRCASPSTTWMHSGGEGGETAVGKAVDGRGEAVESHGMAAVRHKERQWKGGGAAVGRQQKGGGKEAHRRLSDTGFAEQQRVVLPAATEHLLEHGERRCDSHKQRRRESTWRRGSSGSTSKGGARAVEPQATAAA